MGNDKDVLLPGVHNRYNICAVIGICDILHIDMHALQIVLRSFSGVEHRLEDVWVYGGIRWVNDAIATTPESTIAALETYKDEVDTIFLGGKDGGYDFSILVDKLALYNVHNIILFPDSGKIIKKILDISKYTILETSSMQEAVQFASNYTQHGKIALLSCASPSYSLRKNFEEKGKLFKEEVQRIK